MVKITPHETFFLIEPQGPLTKEDFEAIAGQVDPIIESEGELNGIMIRTRTFPGWESFGDMVEHFRFVKDHHQAVEKIALVTDAKVAQLFPAIVNHFVKAEVKHFLFQDYIKAIEWLD